MKKALATTVLAGALLLGLRTQAQAQRISTNERMISRKERVQAFP